MNELDEQMAEVAVFFVGGVTGDTDVLAPSELRREQLDFSLESLKWVDEWIGYLRQHGVDANAQNAAETIIWAGAYVGEVIRRNSSREYHWMRYDDYMAKQPEHVRKLIPYTFGTQFVLVAGTRVTLPINKVGRALEDGPDDNLHYYAAVEAKA